MPVVYLLLAWSLAPYEFDVRERVAAGVEFRERRFFRGGVGPFTMQILEVDPAARSVNLLPVRGHDSATGKETVSALAARYGATAAVNGGYFTVSGEKAGAAVGVYQLNGRVIASGSGRTALLFCAETDFREQLAMQVVSLPGKVNAGACDPVDIVGGGPLLVRAGRASAGDEMFKHYGVRHPRTAVAATGRGTLLFVTLDGRQPRSAGMTLPELAEELIALGAVEAMNLDGGGSTTMIVKNEVRNSPSDGAERPVGDAILIYSVETREQLDALREKLKRVDPAQAERVLREAEDSISRGAARSAR